MSEVYALRTVRKIVKKNNVVGIKVDRSHKTIHLAEQPCYLTWLTSDDSKVLILKHIIKLVRGHGYVIQKTIP